MARVSAIVKASINTTPAPARRWEKLFVDFESQHAETWDEYPENVGDEPGWKRTGSRIPTYPSSAEASVNPRDIVFADLDGIVTIPHAPTQLEAAEGQASPE